jgi:hypothetical protein
MEIVRQATAEEKKDYEDIFYKDRDSPKSKFNEALCKAQQDAIKKGLPFAEKACRDEFNDYWKNAVDTNVRKNGYLIASEIKPFRTDFAKFSDLKNFEVINETEISDADLSKKAGGISVSVKKTDYKFKGYNNVYSVMEDPNTAIQRAKKNVKS